MGELRLPFWLTPMGTGGRTDPDPDVAKEETAHIIPRHHHIIRQSSKTRPAGRETANQFHFFPPLIFQETYGTTTFFVPFPFPCFTLLIFIGFRRVSTFIYRFRGTCPHRTPRFVQDVSGYELRRLVAFPAPHLRQLFEELCHPEEAEVRAWETRDVGLNRLI